ncbi:hypothetical protein H8J95_14555 [Clostridium perfringens]|nr:hypothetical protein [Clostridium perfringens]
MLRHIWQNYLDEDNHLRHESYIKSVYSRRKETIERVFADAKEWSYVNILDTKSQTFLCCTSS